MERNFTFTLKVLLISGCWGLVEETYKLFR